MTPSSDSGGHLVVAAGGVVRREGDGGTEVAVVLRNRYESEGWTLPKGKRQADDPSLKDTAVREVAEETGTDSRPDRVADVVEYPVGADHKVVVFWLMTVTGVAADGLDRSEVTEVRWVPVPELVPLLSYQAEQDMVQRLIDDGALSANGRRSRPRLWWAVGRSRAADWWTRTRARGSGPRLARLEQAIEELDLDLRNGRAVSGSAEAAAAAGHVDLAKDAARRRDVDAGWSQVFRARECRVAWLDEGERDSLLIELRAELAAGDKHSAWRTAAAQALIDPLVEGAEQRPGADGPARLRQALHVVNESHANTYRKLTLLRRHQSWLLGIGLAATLVLLAVLGANASGLDSDRIDTAWLMVSSALIGVVGAVVSAGQRTTTMQPGRIPQVIGTLAASLSRVPIGAVAGLLVWIGGNAGVAPASGSAAAVLAAAFAAGFSERLVAAPRAGKG